MKQGEIWLISLDPSIGSEIKKTRPAVIVSDDALGKLLLKIIVPVTEMKYKFKNNCQNRHLLRLLLLSIRKDKGRVGLSMKKS